MRFEKWEKRRKSKIIYFNKYEEIYGGYFKNCLEERKRIAYYLNNNYRYEGNWKSTKTDIYYNNRDGKIGHYLNDSQIGIHVALTAMDKFH